MRKKVMLVSALLAVATVLLTAAVVGGLDRGDRDRDDVMGYNVLAERMFKGTVASEGHVTEGLMYFRLTTANASMEIQIGPKEFIERSAFKLNTGDNVTVIGMPSIVNEKTVVLAREVRSSKGTLVVRDRFGLPLWDPERPILMDPERLIRFPDSARSVQILRS